MGGRADENRNHFTVTLIMPKHEGGYGFGMDAAPKGAMGFMKMARGKMPAGKKGAAFKSKGGKKKKRRARRIPNFGNKM